MSNILDFLNGDFPPISHPSTTIGGNTKSPEKRTFPWDTVLSIKEGSARMVVHGTDIEVIWCPITKVYWEKQFLLDNPCGICDNEDNEERLLEWDMPTRSQDTASFSLKEFE